MGEENDLILLKRYITDFVNKYDLSDLDVEIKDEQWDTYPQDDSREGKYKTIKIWLEY